MTDTKPRWYILGAGAIGCLWAAYWRLSGFQVTLITPTARSRSYIDLTGPVDDDRQHIAPIEVDSLTVAELTRSESLIKHLLVTTKAHQTYDAIDKIKSKVAKNAKVLILQNGMAGNEIPKLLPHQHLITGITTDGAYRSDELSVNHAGRGTTYVGCEESFLKLLPSAYLQIVSCQDIEIRQWRKLAINCAINGLTVIYNCRNGDLLTNPAAHKQLVAVCREIETVAAALGPSHSLHNFFIQVEETLQNTRDNYSSMHQDIANGRKTEIDYINQYLLTLANRLHIDCPINRAIISAVKKSEKQCL